MKENYVLFPTDSDVLLPSGNKKNHKKKILDNAFTQVKRVTMGLAVLFSFQMQAGTAGTAALAFQDCTDAPLIAGASNITNDSAIINWIAVPGESAATYTLEVYTDAAFTAEFDTFEGISGTSYSVTGLTDGTMYYYRVMVDNTTCGDYGTGSFTAQLSYTPLAVTGFTQDVIANGTGPASGSTTSSVDNSVSGGANFAYLSIDYKPNAGSPNLTYGLPVNRSLTSPNVTGLNYIMQNYSTSNSLRLASQNASGTLSLTEPMALSEVYLAVASGDGSSQISVVVEFTDGSSQDAVTNLNVINWDSPATAETPAIISNIGRVKRTTGVASTGNFKVFQITVPVELENQSKLVSGVTITKTDTGSETKIPNIFAVSGKAVSNCPSLSTVSANALSQTSAEFGWTIGSLGLGGGDITYTLEVYTDAAYTMPVEGSPFTDIDEDSYTVTGLTLDAQYFYRVKANNGTCDSEYMDADFILGYCVPARTGSFVSYYITNVGTTGGYTNINYSSDGNTAYTNNSDTQIVSKPAGTTFSYSVTRSSVYSTIGVWVDWNGDLDFDDEGEAIAVYVGAFGQPSTVTGNITIPEGTALGNYRMRVRSTYYFNTTVTPCGDLTYSDTEDYTITVAEQPEDCEVPAMPALALSDVTASEVTGTVTPADDEPTGYILIRSTLDALTDEPETGATYIVGTEFGGGTVIAAGATIDSFTHFLAANTHYYYYLFAYNEGGLDCFGPIYSEAATADAVTCAIATKVAGASNITNTSANLNWSSVVGNGGNEATYTVEVYSDEALTDLIGTYTTTTNSYNATGLTNGDTYYYRVKAETEGCDDDTWSATASFTAQSSYTPLDVTGLNADVIANGTGIANLSTTNAVDAVNNSYIALDYERVSGTVTTIGLPLNRTLTSGAIPALKFLLADYGGNNALRLPTQDQSGTLTFTQPVKLSDLYLAVTSGSGGSTINAQIFFEDGTSQIAAGISVSDWYGAASGSQPALISNIGRANRANTTGNVETGNSKIFYVTLPINADNQTKLVTSVTITKTSGGLTEPVPNIFAVSGNVIDCPSLSELAVVAGIEDAEITFGTAGTTEEASYVVEVYTDEEMTMPVDGSPFTTTDADFTVTGLDPLTTYYYHIQAVTDVCTTDSEGSFTTICLAPDAPEAVAQSVCTGTTVAGLEAEGAENAVINWYASEDGDALADETVVEAGTYYVSQTIEGCESEMLEVTITLTVTAVPQVDAQTVCDGTTIAGFDAVPAEGGMLNWYASEGGEVLAEGTVAETGTYYVSQTIEGCESEVVEVTVTVNPVPQAPDAAAMQEFNEGETLEDLEVAYEEGATGNWYVMNESEEYVSVEPATVLEDGATYYVSQTLLDCESELTAITVNEVLRTDAFGISGLTVYPNPATDVLTISAKGLITGVTVTNMLGQTVMQQSSSSGTLQLNVSSLSEGAYMLQVQSEEKSASVKIIKR